MSPVRRCSRATCTQVAVATLTYVYADRAAVVGPLATYAEPHCYDLCEIHATRLVAPMGWELVRLDLLAGPGGPTGDDLEALADAVREAARPPEARAPRPPGDGPGPGHGHGPGPGLGRRGHLRVLPSPAPSPDVPDEEPAPTS